jgi:hypothetical protein
VQDRRHFSRLTTGNHERQWAGAEFSGNLGLFRLVLSMLFWAGADARAELQMLERFVAPRSRSEVRAPGGNGLPLVGGRWKPRGRQICMVMLPNHSSDEEQPVDA